MGQYDLAIGDDDGMAGDEETLQGDDDLGGPRKRGGGGRPPRPEKSADDLTQVFNFPHGPQGSVNFGAGVAGVLTGRPQRAFRTERLVIPSSLSLFFVIMDLVIGRDSMFVNSESASAEIFSQAGVGVALRGFAARPGIDISINVQNIDIAAHAFYGSIIGPASR